jgi:hypothetical protein
LQSGSEQAAVTRGAATSGRGAPRAGTTPKTVPGVASAAPDIADLAGADDAALAATVPATAAVAVAVTTAPSVSQPRMFKFVPLCRYS